MTKASPLEPSISAQLNARKPLSGELSHKQLGMLVALASMGMLFGTLILSYMLARARSPVWPPIGVDPVDPLLPSLASGALIASSLMIHSSFLKLKRDQLAAFKKRWTLGLSFAVVFVMLQASVLVRLYQLGVKIDSSLFASIIYTIICFHGLHVVAGMLSLLVVRQRADRYSQYNLEGPQLVAWFWHFLDVIWLIMFILMVWK